MTYDSTNINLFNNVITRLNTRLSELCLFLDPIMPINKKCFVDMTYHNSSRLGRFVHHRWIRVSVKDLISDNTVSFVNSRSYDYLKIMTFYYPTLLDISKRIELQYELDCSCEDCSND